ncbi:ACP S-malonyltransferase [Gemmatimonas groenlandica]|uniref:Malonyl CoA-acyl carrier protein transacylase n=1 Tax=Gemmatimonas groenlandica TaxID=2732249 RepID=A0A6M4IIZ1_9BACT|nr:ACP S-malonyltransferase [Gemmatimonas groenlandica]QJR35064.1 ACP S-malonyltransferase [Gemmatimonas groenlandica]
MEYVLLLPGQGSQKVGMGKDLADAFPVAREVFDAVDDAVAASISTLAFAGPADELTRTLNAQPALLAHSAAVWAVVKSAIGPHVRAAAGHSLGEFSAYHLAGAIDVAAAARIVRRRGTLMYEQGVARPGAMAAILGALTSPIDDICRQATAERGLVVPANYNSDEQVVISGEVSGVARAMELAKEAGAKRCLPLPVSGAFHSPLMEPAVAGLSDALRAESWNDPQVPVVANVNASPVTSASAACDLLVQQLTAPVQWTRVSRRLVEQYPDATFVEIGSGAVLTGLLRRLAPSVKTLSCGTVAEVEKLLSLASVPA